MKDPPVSPAAIIDSDLDLIPDVQDSRPRVANIPALVFAFEGTQFGLSYNITTGGRIERTERQSLKLESSETGADTNRVDYSNVDVVKRNLSHKLALSLSPKDMSLNLSGTLESGTESTRKTETKLTSEQIAKYDKQRTSLIETVSKETVDYSSTNAFIDSGLRFYNYSDRPIEIKRLQVAFDAVAPASGETHRTIRIVDINSVEVPAASRESPYFSVPLNVKDLRSDELMRIVEAGDVIRPRMQRYEVVYDDRTFRNFGAWHDSARPMSVRLNVIDQFGKPRTYIVFPEKRETLQELLSDISDPGTTSSVVTSGANPHVSSFFGKESGLAEWGDPFKYTSSELTDGAWIVFSHGSIRNLFVEPLPNGSEMTIAYVTKADIQAWASKEEETSFHLGPTFPEGDSIYHINWTVTIPPGKPNPSIEEIQQYRRQQLQQSEQWWTSTLNYLATGPTPRTSSLSVLGRHDILRLKLTVRRCKIEVKEDSRSFPGVDESRRQIQPCSYEQTSFADYQGNVRIRFGSQGWRSLTDLLPVLTKSSQGSSTVLEFPPFEQVSGLGVASNVDIEVSFPVGKYSIGLLRFNSDSNGRYKIFDYFDKDIAEPRDYEITATIERHP